MDSLIAAFFGIVHAVKRSVPSFPFVRFPFVILELVSLLSISVLSISPFFPFHFCPEPDGVTCVVISRCVCVFAIYHIGSMVQQSSSSLTMLG